MNYLGAKAELQSQPPKVSFSWMAIEAVLMLVIAVFLLNIFN
jgi:hypothetical protein